MMEIMGNYEEDDEGSYLSPDDIPEFSLSSESPLPGNLCPTPTSTPPPSPDPVYASEVSQVAIPLVVEESAVQKDTTLAVPKPTPLRKSPEPTKPIGKPSAKEQARVSAPIAIPTTKSVPIKTVDPSPPTVQATTPPKAVVQPPPPKATVVPVQLKTTAQPSPPKATPAVAKLTPTKTAEPSPPKSPAKLTSTKATIVEVAPTKIASTKPVPVEPSVKPAAVPVHVAAVPAPTKVATPTKPAEPSPAKPAPAEPSPTKTSEPVIATPEKSAHSESTKIKQPDSSATPAKVSPFKPTESTVKPALVEPSPTKIATTTGTTPPKTEKVPATKSLGTTPPKPISTTPAKPTATPPKEPTPLKTTPPKPETKSHPVQAPTSTPVEPIKQPAPLKESAKNTTAPTWKNAAKPKSPETVIAEPAPTSNIELSPEFARGTIVDIPEIKSSLQEQDVQQFIISPKPKRKDTSGASVLPAESATALTLEPEASVKLTTESPQSESKEAPGATPVPTSPTKELIPTEPLPTEPISSISPISPEPTTPTSISTEPAPTVSLPVELPTAQPIPIEPPVESTLVEQLPATPISVGPTIAAEMEPVEPLQPIVSASTEATPIELTTTEPTTTEPTSIEPTPRETTSTEPIQTESTPVTTVEPMETASTELTQTESTPVSTIEPTPTEPTPIEPTLIEPTPIEPTPIEPMPMETAESTQIEPLPESIPLGIEPAITPKIPIEQTVEEVSEPTDIPPTEPTHTPIEPAQQKPEDQVSEPEPEQEFIQESAPIPTGPTEQLTQQPIEPEPMEDTKEAPAKPTEQVSTLGEETAPTQPVKPTTPPPEVRKRTLTFVEPDSPPPARTRRGTDSVLVDLGTKKAASFHEIPTSPRMFVDGRTLRRKPAGPKHIVDKNGTIVDRDKLSAAQYLMRKRIANEILTTERSYIKGMQTVSELQATVKTNKSLNDVEFYTVFANLPEVLQYHVNFLKTIEYAISDTWRDMTIVSEIFEQFDYAQVYSKYILNYNKCCVALHQLRRRNQLFQKDVEEFEMAQRRGTGLHNLDAYLVFPVQRVPRYLLLLRDLHKYTPSSHPDHFLLPGIVDRIQRELDQINTSITPGELEEIRKIVMIDESIDNMTETLFRPDRKYIREGNLVLKRKGNSVIRDSFRPARPTSLAIFKKKQQQTAPMWFLFTDVLIYCEKKQNPEGGKLFDYKASVNISEIDEVHEKALLTDKDTKKSKKGYTKNHAFRIIVDGVEWLMYASSEDEKKKWVNDMILLLLHHKKRVLQEGKK